MSARPRIFAALLCGFLLVALLQAHPSTRQTRLHTLLTSSSLCNPYEAYGQLRIDVNSPLVNRWVPFDATCRAPMLMASLGRLVWAGRDVKDLDSPLAQAEGIMEDTAPDGFDWEDMEWARGKTVVAHGDSLVRFQNIHFCKMLTGEGPVSITPDHEYWPYSPEEVYHVGDKQHLDPPSPQAGQLHKRVSAEAHGPRYCYVPEIDFMYIFYFNFGLDTFGYFSNQESAVVGPYKFEDRMEYGTRRITEHIQRKLGRRSTEPDMVFLGSALWDNVRWLREDVAENRNPNLLISNDRIYWYKNRVQAVVERAVDLFPETPIRWIGHSFPVNKGNNGWFFQDVDASKRPEQLLQRLWRMTHAARQGVLDAARYGNVRFVPWGERILGTQEYQVDDLHQTMFPGSYVWADMMLYELRRSIKGY